MKVCYTVYMSLKFKVRDRVRVLPDLGLGTVLHHEFVREPGFCVAASQCEHVYRVKLDSGRRVTRRAKYLTAKRKPVRLSLGDCVSHKRGWLGRVRKLYRKGGKRYATVSCLYTQASQGVWDVQVKNLTKSTLDPSLVLQNDGISCLGFGVKT